MGCWWAWECPEKSFIDHERKGEGARLSSSRQNARKKRHETCHNKWKRYHRRWEDDPLWIDLTQGTLEWQDAFNRVARVAIIPLADSADKYCADPVKIRCPPHIFFNMPLVA